MSQDPSSQQGVGRPIPIFIGYDPREAVAYVCEQPRIESIVLGAYSRANIRTNRPCTFYR